MVDLGVVGLSDKVSIVGGGLKLNLPELVIGWTNIVTKFSNCLLLPFLSIFSNSCSCTFSFSLKQY